MRIDIKFDELIIKSGFKSKNSFAGYIKNKLDTGFLEFYNKLKELEIINKEGESTEISSYITRGLVGKDDSVTDKTIESMAKLNLRENDLEFNLKQIFLNQYINAVAINQILLGDQAKTLKDIVDAVKRAKGQTGQGVNTSLDIYDEAHNIKPVDNISLVAFTEPTQLSKVQGSSNMIKLADAQGYITAKAFKYLQYATGRMQNEGQFNLLNDVERGTALRTRGEVYFGTDQLKGLDKQNAMINSKKYMYFDGETYAKTSFFTLTKEFTSKGENFSEPRPSREALHYLRIRLEEIEEASSGNTLGIALPASGLKMQKLNLQDANEITSPEG